MTPAIGEIGLLVAALAAVAGASVLALFAWQLRRRGPEEGFEYVYVNQDGSARELSPAERDYLSMDFEGGDGGRPYVKAGYRSRDGWGSLSGFIKRRDVPARIAIAPVHPDYDALEKQLGDDIPGLLSVAGTVVATDADGPLAAGAADNVSAHERFERARQHYLAGQRRREQLAKVT